MSVVEKVKTRIQKVTGRKILRGQGARGQMKLGGGAIMEKARSRINIVTAKIRERRPGLASQVKEFKPGSRIRELLSGDIVAGRGMAVETDRKPKPSDSRNISVEW